MQTREYVVKEGRALKATSKGRVVTAFLQRYFAQYMDYDFTSEMEAQLDDIAGRLSVCIYIIAHTCDTTMVFALYRGIVSLFNHGVRAHDIPTINCMFCDMELFQYYAAAVMIACMHGHLITLGRK